LIASGLIKQHRVVLLASALAVVVIAVAAWLWSGAEDAGGGSGTVKVEERMFTPTIAAIGSVKPQIGAEVRVGSRISGQVRRLGANIGDRVQKGQVIAELETEELDALIAERRAELSLATAKLVALASLTPDAVAQAEAEVARFEATAKNAAEVWQRQQILLRDSMITQAEADLARERNLVAQAQLESARRALALVRTGNAEQRKQAEAEQARAQAALQSAAVDRSFTVIRSPISGHVASIATQEGETVAAGLNAPTFVTIVDLARLQVNAYVDEVDIGQVTVGQRAAFTVDAFPGRDFEAQVTAIYPSASIQDNVVKYVVALNILREYNGVLRPEMTASVQIRMPQRTVLALPTRALARESGRSVAYVVEDGRVEPRPVRLGRRDGAWVEVMQGLRAGQSVLLDPPTPGGGAKP
jgi:multidrug efflux pump subunit AcrA (membrane-fusion protein)